MTTPTPGTAGDPQQPESAGSDPTREIDVEQPTHEHATHEQPTEEQASAHTRVFGTQAPDAPVTTEADAAPSPGRAQPAPVSWAPEPATEPPPRRPSGPHLPPVLLGIVCLAIAGLAIWQEVTDVQVDWGNVGPLGIVAIGALLVLLGLVGLLGSRRRSSS